MTANHSPNTDLLFEHFATLATAPEGIARLRELILQLAVQGKLGTQDARDEPASVLLGRIRKEKDRLVKEGKIPKEKTVEYDNETLDRPLPEHWILVRLGEISDKIHYGYTASADQTNRRIRLLRITDIQNNRVNWDLVPGCEIDDSNFLSYSINVGDLLIARTGGTVGKSFLVRDQPVPAVFASYLIRVVPNKNLNSEYVKLFADSSTYWDQLYRMCMGTGQPNVNGMSLRSLIVPLPPLAEQQRIVEKVDRFMAICDELDARQQQERTGCLRLGTASLAGLQNAESPEEFERQWAQVCDAFDLILDCPENVAVLRQTILQLAVQGRLVRQEPGDEPARVILNKLQKSSDYSPIDSDEIPYSLPKGWDWERLGTLTKFIDYRGKTPSKILSGIKLITAKNVRMGYLNDEPREYISPEEYDMWMTRGFPSVGDLLFTTEAPMGNVAQISITEKFALAQRVINFHPYEGIFSTYLMYAIMSPFLQSCIEEKSSGVTARGIKAAKLKLIPIPIPPLAEQHRIVAKVDALMALCDTLESRLKERAGVQGKLAGAVVKQVAG